MLSQSLLERRREHTEIAYERALGWLYRFKIPSCGGIWCFSCCIWYRASHGLWSHAEDFKTWSPICSWQRSRTWASLLCFMCSLVSHWYGYIHHRVFWSSCECLGHKHNTGWPNQEILLICSLFPLFVWVTLCHLLSIFSILQLLFSGWITV